MKTLIATNNPVTLSFAQALLRDADIPCVVLDQHMSLVEGSIGVIPRRLCVDVDDWDEAAAVMRSAEMGHELEPH